MHTKLFSNEANATGFWYTAIMNNGIEFLYWSPRRLSLADKRTEAIRHAGAEFYGTADIKTIRRITS